MPLELAVDLSSLALYDIIMFCDDRCMWGAGSGLRSGGMGAWV